MKRSKQIHVPGRARVKMSADQVAQFIEEFQAIMHGEEGRTKAISLRVPQNLLRNFKTQADLKGLSYQTQIVQLMREWVNSNSVA